MGNSTMSLRSGYNNNPDNSLISKENTSSIFGGVLNSEEEKMNLICLKKRIKKQQNEEAKNNNINANNKVPTMFEWSFKGNSVYLTGSFCNWKQFFLMKKDENGVYRLILDLNRGFHQYKFKVDNEWKININFPTYNDHGFINNYIDTSNWEIQGEYENEEIDHSLFSTSDIDLINYMKDKDINLQLSNEFYNANIYYNNYIPLQCELFKIAPQFPYQNIIDCINKDIIINDDKIINNKIKNNKFKVFKHYKIKEKPLNKDENNNKILHSNRFMHEQINHFHLKKIKEHSCIKSSMIHRFRLKFATFVYYK